MIHVVTNSGFTRGRQPIILHENEEILGEREGVRVPRAPGSANGMRGEQMASRSMGMEPHATIPGKSWSGNQQGRIHALVIHQIPWIQWKFSFI